MSPFAGNRIDADEQPAADHDAAAHSGTEDDAEDGAAAGGRAVDRLGQRKAIGVVGEAHRAAERGLDIAAERPAVEPGRIGVLHQSGSGDDRAGNADADRSGRADLALQRGDQPGNRRDRAVIIADRRGDSTARPDPARRI